MLLSGWNLDCSTVLLVISASHRHMGLYRSYATPYVILRGMLTVALPFSLLSIFPLSAGPLVSLHEVCAYASAEANPPRMLRRFRAQTKLVAASVESEGGQSRSFMLLVCLRLSAKGKLP